MTTLNNSPGGRMISHPRGVCIRKANRTLMCIVLSIQALVVAGQSSVVKGRITDEMVEPIPGVNVLVKGIATGAGSDLEGRYSVNVNGGTDAVSVFSAVGSDTQEGQPNIRFDFFMGTQQLQNFLEVANLSELLEIEKAHHCRYHEGRQLLNNRHHTLPVEI